MTDSGGIYRPAGVGGFLENRNGFTLMELLIVVAVIGIVAAIAIPGLFGARVAANESTTLGDIRALTSAQAAYQSANSGFYDAHLSCLTEPSSPSCIPSYPIGGPTFLDSLLASQQAKAGYNRWFSSGGLVQPPPATSSPTSTDHYRYDATPTRVGQSGIRGFAGDNTGRICFTPDGTPVAPGASQGTLPADCQDLR